MRRVAWVLFVVATVLALGASASGQSRILHDVVGSGGGTTSGASHTVRGTAGEACVGIVGGDAYTASVGYWHMPHWVMTGADSPPIPCWNWLGQNYPNPFNPTTMLEFSLREKSHVRLTLYDASGREVLKLVDREMEPGVHREVVHAGGLPSGVYFARMDVGTFTETRKLVLLK